MRPQLSAGTIQALRSLAAPGTPLERAGHVYQFSNGSPVSGRSVAALLSERLIERDRAASRLSFTINRAGRNVLEKIERDPEGSS